MSAIGGNWHRDAGHWHGPIHREEQSEVYDFRTDRMHPLIFEYRECGCVTTREVPDES